MRFSVLEIVYRNQFVKMSIANSILAFEMAARMQKFMEKYHKSIQANHNYTCMCIVFQIESNHQALHFFVCVCVCDVYALQLSRTL